MGNKLVVMHKILGAGQPVWFSPANIDSFMNEYLVIQFKTTKVCDKKIRITICGADLPTFKEDLMAALYLRHKGRIEKVLKAHVTRKLSAYLPQNFYNEHLIEIFWIKV